MSSSISKIVLITGANQGIGFEIARSLSSKAGYHVLLGSRDAQRGINASKQLQEQGLHVEPITIEYVGSYLFSCPFPLMQRKEYF
jgi:NAD(P)-dependent dehydrogenase (short-subunit alcohol dehydrogenase family)